MYQHLINFKNKNSIRKKQKKTIFLLSFARHILTTFYRLSLLFSFSFSYQLTKKYKISKKYSIQFIKKIRHVVNDSVSVLLLILYLRGFFRPPSMPIEQRLWTISIDVWRSLLGVFGNSTSMELLRLRGGGDPGSSCFRHSTSSKMTCAPPLVVGTTSPL